MVGCLHSIVAPHSFVKGGGLDFLTQQNPGGTEIFQDQEKREKGIFKIFIGGKLLEIKLQTENKFQNEFKNIFMSYIQSSDRPGKLRELANTSGKSGKTWKTPGILFECNYFDFVQTLIGISHVLTSFVDHFVIFLLIECIFIFIMQLPLYLNDL